MIDIRQQALSQWFAKQLNLATIELITVSADASFRRYFRYEQDTSSYILVDAPPSTEKNQEFIDFALSYAEQGIDVPRVIYSDIEQGFLCLTDLGDQTLLPLLLDGELSWYKLAIKQLDLIAKVSPRQPQAYYDSTFFSLELALFEQWFCQKLLQQPEQVCQQHHIDSCFSQLVNNAISQPHVSVHRDFHSRNIMVRDKQSLAVIDFQDTVTGPLTYDLASLLKDCYFKLPLSVHDELLNQAFEQLTQSQGLDCSFSQFKTWYDLMALQRHLKVCGIFSRLSIRDAKHDYLKDLPLVIEYIIETCRQYPQMKPLLDLFEQSLLPALAQRNILCTP